MAAELTAIITKINNIVRSDRNIRIALSTTLAVHKDRIFKMGLDASGQQIGTYSTKPESISTKQQARQTGKTFFKGGYAEYKKIIGRNPGFVILRNTDQMMMDYGLVGANSDYGFGFHNHDNYSKSQWMEDKYKKSIFDLSDYEAGILSEVLTRQLIEAL